MTKLSEIKGERALDILAEMLEPFTEIFADQEVKKAAAQGRMPMMKSILTRHKRAVITILALMDDADPGTYEPTLAEIPVKVMQILNDPALKPFFTSQGQKKVEKYSGSATESTEE